MLYIIANLSKFQVILSTSLSGQGETGLEMNDLEGYRHVFTICCQ